MGSHIISSSQAIYIGLFARILIAIWNSFFGPSPGGDLDAVTFHLDAIEYSNRLILDEFQIGWIYTFVLGVIYYYTVPSLFVGSLVSCLAWLLSAIYLDKSCKLLIISSKPRANVLLIYALLPSSLFLTSITLREPFQLLFINLSVYAVVKINMLCNDKYWFLLIASVILMGALHGVLVIVGVIITLLQILVNLLTRSRVIKRSAVRLVFFLFPAIVFIILIFNYQNFGLFEDGLVGEVVSHREKANSIDGRANYSVERDRSGDILFISWPILLFQYLFEPLPWRISGVMDFIVFSENILRGYLIFKSIQSLKTVRFANLIFKQQLLFYYLVIEFIWAVGTVNWGTAIRHHIPSIGLLLLTVFGFQQKSIKNFIFSVNRIK